MILSRHVIRSLAMRVVGAAALNAPVSPAAAAFKHLRPEMEAADFTLKTLDGKEITFAELKKNPVSLLVF